MGTIDHQWYDVFFFVCLCNLLIVNSHNVFQIQCYKWQGDDVRGRHDINAQPFHFDSTVPWFKLKDGRSWTPFGAITLCCDGFQTPYYTLIPDYQSDPQNFSALQISKRWIDVLESAEENDPAPLLRRKGNTLFFPLGNQCVFQFKCVEI